MNLSTCQWSTKILDLQKLELAILQKIIDASVVGNRLDDNNNQIANLLIHFLLELSKYLHFQNYNKQGLLLTQMHVYKKIDNWKDVRQLWRIKMSAWFVASAIYGHASIAFLKLKKIWYSYKRGKSNFLYHHQST